MSWEIVSVGMPDSTISSMMDYRVYTVRNEDTGEVRHVTALGEADLGRKIDAGDFDD